MGHQRQPGRLVPLLQVHEHEGYEWANPRWLRRATYEHWLPYVKAGRRVLIDLDDIDEYVAANRVEAVSS
jgi:8-oxo-dGTP pyrophosphatase MutT (NUDIX family)